MATPGTRRLTDNYPPAYTDFFGYYLGGAGGPRGQPFIREVRPIYDAEKVDDWRSVGEALWKYIDTLYIEWTFINPLAYANAGEATSFCSFVVIIGVKPYTVSFDRAVEVATVAEKMLHGAGFAEAEVAIVERERTPSVARGPQMLSFDPLLDNVPELRKLFTPTLGLPIAPLKFPPYAGTGSLFFRLGGDDERVALLTSSPREEIISPGSGTFDNALKALRVDIGSQLRSITAWDAVLVRLGEPTPGQDMRVTERRREYQSLVDGAKSRIGQVN
ncbi:hypothetical protein V8D89_014533, partial [Ganoderma adspersum]